MSMKVTTLAEGEGVTIGELVRCPHCQAEFEADARRHEVRLLKCLKSGLVKLGISSRDWVRKCEPDN